MSLQLLLGGYNQTLTDSCWMCVRVRRVIVYSRTVELVSTLPCLTVTCRCDPRHHHTLVVITMTALLLLLLLTEW